MADEEPKKRGRGRVAKAEPKTEAAPKAAEKRKATTPVKTDSGDKEGGASPAKRGRGRPKGSARKKGKAKAKKSPSASGRGRGRPKKVEEKEQSSGGEEPASD